MSEKMIKCIGCKALVPDIEGPTFRYPNAASPGCWKIYNDILNKEYGEFNYPPVHRLTVDTYAVQHPGDRTIQTVQSVNIHLIALCLMLERGFDFKMATGMMQKVKKNFREEFIWLDPPEERGEITVVNVIKAANLEEHEKLVNKWAESVWQSWAKHHKTVYSFIDRLKKT